MGLQMGLDPSQPAWQVSSSQPSASWSSSVSKIFYFPAFEKGAQWYILEQTMVQARWGLCFAPYPYACHPPPTSHQPSKDQSEPRPQGYATPHELCHTPMESATPMKCVMPPWIVPPSLYWLPPSTDATPSLMCHPPKCVVMVAAAAAAKKIPWPLGLNLLF